jgi:O-acetyl-ADP-ribose deacetylase (regulator of RNase III)
MIETATGNLVEAGVDALVNTVNCVGFMGKGIALQFKQAFPENNAAYERACTHDEVQPGRMFIFETRSMIGPKYIINFPTKRHWRGKSRIEDVEAGLKALVEDVEAGLKALIEDVEAGLKALVEDVQRLDVKSVAVPPLGCGLGGLNWNDVRPLIEQAFAVVPGIRVLVFEPKAAPAAKNMPIRTKTPNMTHARALFIKLMERYAGLAYRLTLLDVLDPNSESYRRLEKVGSLIEGFETPYGVELLSSVHWVACHGHEPAEDEASAIAAVHGGMTASGRCSRRCTSLSPGDGCWRHNGSRRTIDYKATRQGSVPGDSGRCLPRSRELPVGLSGEGGAQ